VPDVEEETIPPTAPNNSSNSFPEELFGGREAAPQAPITSFENARHSGRLRKNEEIGIYGDLPVCDVVRFRAKYGRHIEGMSEDMQEEYDYWYFTPPSKRKDKEKHARHVRAWNRRTKWLGAMEEREESGSSEPAPVTDLSEERRARGR
jgi:hypothetical protein